eukprot:1157390-Pelagomonas_calceolata.AAC.3
MRASALNREVQRGASAHVHNLAERRAHRNKAALGSVHVAAMLMETKYNETNNRYPRCGYSMRDTRHMHATGVMSLAGLNGHQTYASNWCSSHGQTASGVQIGPH